MSRYRSTDSSVEGVILILFVLVMIVMIMVGFLIAEGTKVGVFDRSFSAEKFTIESSTIKLGETGHPMLTSYSGYIPGSGGPSTSPRIIQVTECKSYKMAKETNAIHASTRFPNPEMINIQMPERDSGSFNVCVPKGAQIEVILWYAK